MQISTRVQTRLQRCRSPLQGEVSSMWIRSVVWCGLSRYLHPCCETLFDPISSCHNCTEEFRHDSIRHQDSVPVWRSPRTNLHDMSIVETDLWPQASFTLLITYVQRSYSPTMIQPMPATMCVLSNYCERRVHHHGYLRWCSEMLTSWRSSSIPGVLTEITEFLSTHFKVPSLPAYRFVT